MILPLHERVRERLLAVLQQLYQIPHDELPPLPIEYPPKRELGDLATPVAFELARRLRKAPRAIAQELAPAIGPIEGDQPSRGCAERVSQYLPGPCRVPERRLGPGSPADSSAGGV